MKKIILSVLIMILMPLFSYADIISHKLMAVVQYDMSYKTVKENQIIELISIQECKISDNIIIKENERVQVKILKYIEPKRGKKDGYYEIEYLNNIMNVKGTMRVSTPKDIEGLVKNVGVNVTGYLLGIPGLSQALAVSKGLLKPSENKSRLASAGENLYQSTPLTYVEKGEDFSIGKNGIVVLKLK